MEIVHISRKMFLKLLLNPNPFEQGQFGIITLINDELYKVYYKDFIRTYLSKNENELDFEVNNALKVENSSNMGLRSPNKRLEDLKRLLETKSNDLITGVLSYNGLLVGVVMNYYNGYTLLSDAAKSISEDELDKYIKISYDLVDDLMINGIVPGDVSEDNILVNTETGNVKLIDLDGYETTYGPKNYINEYPDRILFVKQRFSEMTERLKSKKYKKVYNK